ncbi:MAG: hypothetical protein GC179_09690 [Anaerolineaceae bacterium]|nr:hypothetical protein [Anaerolineaceae bacterium]
MKKFLAIFIALAFVFGFSFTFTTLAYTEVYPPTTCPYTDSPHYNPNLAISVQNEQLRLSDLSTGTVIRILEDKVLDFYPYALYWGLNCRYFFANDIVQPLENSWARFTNIYDITTGAQIFHTRRDPFFVQLWSPSRQQFIIKSITGTFFMSETIKQPVFLFRHDPAGRSMRRYEWDTVHNQVLIIFAGNAGYLNIYDINTGANLAAISNPSVCRPPVNYVASADGHYLTVFTGAGYAGSAGKPACVTIYDRQSGAQTSVNAETLTGQETSQIALSPDGRYLVIGIRALRVWDLTNLPANFSDRLPTYRFEGPMSIIHLVRFLDATTVETVSSENGTQRWDVTTGQLLT